MFTRGDVGIRSCLVGLFHEFGEMIGAGMPFDHFASTKIAKACLRMFRNDPERGEHARSRDSGSNFDAFVKGL